ncbi:unnamed protein product [Adineta steineri]|uniref:ubiquitinyl hydrolase 1 n=1 Tax=Adineta steineri TaxID=433720 RepID=A0A818RLZ2_9BILA|nr:unnamed protein product [Adineta steineri]
MLTRKRKDRHEENPEVVNADHSLRCSTLNESCTKCQSQPLIPKKPKQPWLSRKRQLEENESSIPDVLRQADKNIEIVDSSSLSDAIHTTPQEQILAKSVLEYSDSIVLPTHLEEEIVTPAVDNEQNVTRNILQPLEPPASEISNQTKNSFRDFLLQPTDVQRGQCGLQNIGNTCFMNSALQCLSNVSDLTEYILKNGVTDILNTTSNLGTHGKLALAYANLIENMWSGKQTVAEGFVVKRYVSELSPRFAGYSQQDSHEFLNVLLDALHEDLKQDSDIVENEISLISEMFYGQIRSIVTCDCGEPLITFDSISFLALPIPNLPMIYHRRINSGKSVTQTITLYDCFDEVFKVEKLSDNDTVWIKWRTAIMIPLTTGHAIFRDLIGHVKYGVINTLDQI